jgi:hypothetical protein
MVAGADKLRAKVSRIIRVGIRERVWNLVHSLRRCPDIFGEPSYWPTSGMPVTNPARSHGARTFGTPKRFSCTLPQMFSSRSLLRIQRDESLAMIARPPQRIKVRFSLPPPVVDENSTYLLAPRSRID